MSGDASRTLLTWLRETLQPAPRVLRRVRHAHSECSGLAAPAPTALSRLISGHDAGEAVPVVHGPQNQIVPMAGAIRHHENAGNAIHATERIPSCRFVVTRMWRLPLFMELDHAHRLA
ncbi:hypothetical protein ACQUJS_07565 [Ralstonia pseudosolanacearum]|uniref:Uncharacterized protein n=2 Tax=Ralstonia solanacearum TaxID=305 RepID=A0AA92EEY9_RALSL|nr:hypothetical protein [Ralstonia pseudosolanacearum]QCX50684.1 hypothetical protein E7Z57_17170 [Ralstonia pseudosolanacearum]